MLLLLLISRSSSLRLLLTAVLCLGLYLLTLDLTKSIELVHLILFDSNDTLNFRVAASPDIIADKEFVDKLVFAIETQSYFVGKVHGRVEELLVGQLHGSVDGLDLYGGSVVERWLAHLAACSGLHDICCLLLVLGLRRFNHFF